MPSSLAKASRAPLAALARLGNVAFAGRNEKPIIVSGSPRGGTTWVFESIAGCFARPRIFWEPLQASNPANSTGLFGKRPYIDERHVGREQERFFQSLLNGTMANSHTVRLRHRPSNVLKLSGDGRLLLKFVRGNGVVGFLKRRFDLPKPIIIVRHPCAVVASQLRMGTWEDHPHIDPELARLRPELHRLLDSSLPLYKRLAATWAADVLAAYESRDDVHIVLYENLLSEGAEVLRPVFESWGFANLPGKLQSALVEQSSTTHSWAASDGNKQLTRWKSDLGQREIADILDICSQVGIHLYDESALPARSIYEV